MITACRHAPFRTKEADVGQLADIGECIPEWNGIPLNPLPLEGEAKCTSCDPQRCPRRRQDRLDPVRVLRARRMQAVAGQFTV